MSPHGPPSVSAPTGRQLWPASLHPVVPVPVSGAGHSPDSSSHGLPCSQRGPRPFDPAPFVLLSGPVTCYHAQPPPSLPSHPPPRDLTSSITGSHLLAFLPSPQRGCLPEPSTRPSSPESPITLLVAPKCSSPNRAFHSRDVDVAEPSRSPESEEIGASH